ncbi:Hypothetical protein TFLO_1622 [Trichococcus flocculiformis]|uniref:Uncharacterized protein n=1 Tax=Trichococcus flocculiformis TaxID=82803 RepID=A0AB38BIE9_9LACT|nr:hypothetical protein [Trichococcus flocculiformis]CZQ93032.1 Hypothetical protein TFLO_1622 [Trichococcus flocculiformis]SFH84896.1 hypothetical protein SAMN04488507_101923 [Trichococcus flocculiformis]
MDVGMEYEILMLQLGSLARKLFNAEENLSKYQEALEKAIATLEKENRDLERLRHDSFSNTLLKLFGNFDRRYDKEYREIISAKVEFDKAYAMKIAAARRVKEVEADIEEKKLRLRNIKEDVLRKHPDMNQVVSERQQQILAIQHEWRETNEAEQAGLAVLEALSDIITGLDAADAISTWDLITDNSLILDFLKYDKLDAAEASLLHLEQTVYTFARELRDLDFVFETDLETISSTQRALDIFFDNLFSDWGTKAIIEKNIENLKKLQDSTEDVMESLAAKKRELETTLEVLAIEDDTVV